MRLAVGLSLSLLVAFFASAQNPPASAMQALALAAQSIGALTNGTTISDVTLTGNVTSIAGSDVETGTGAFATNGTGESRVDLTLNGGTRSDIRKDLSSCDVGAQVNMFSLLRLGQRPRVWPLEVAKCY